MEFRLSEAVTIELIRAIPAVLWVVFAALVFLVLRRAILPQLGRLSNVKTPVFEATFAERLLDEAGAQIEDGAPTSPSVRRAAISRIEHAAEILRGGRILWVDDNPNWHAPLTQLFRQLGMTVEGARSTTEALARLDERAYDLIITDMRRDTEEPADTAGVTLLNALRRRMVGPPVLVVSGGFDPQLGVHPGIFAYAKGADEVVHRVIDIMERVRFGASV